MNQTHTPGPWSHRKIERDGQHGFTVDTQDASVEICEIYPKANPVAVNLANARLITAAPSMLDLLSAMVDRFGGLEEYGADELGDLAEFIREASELRRSVSP